MSTVKKFEDLEMWQLGRELHKRLGKLIDDQKLRMNYRLIHQVEGASGSIMDNIAEGFERGTRQEFIVFLGYAKGSCGELRSQLYRLLDRKYIQENEFTCLIEIVLNISGKIQRFIEYLRKIDIKGVRNKGT